MLTYIVDGLAVHRLTRLITKDTITERVRGTIIRDAYIAAGHEYAGDEHFRNLPPENWNDVQADNEPKLAAFIRCPWCVSVWTAFGVVALRHTIPNVWNPIATALALSSVAGLLAQHD